MKPVYYILIATILTAIIIFITIKIIKRKKSVRLLKTLHRLSSFLNSEIKTYDICDDVAISIDKASELILFFREGKNENTSEFIKLTEIRSCRIVNIFKEKQEETGYNALSEKLGLSFIPFDENKPEYYIGFKELTDKTLSYKKFMMAYKWWRLISDELNRKNKQSEISL